MAGTLKRIAGPAYLTTSAADIYTPPASTIYTIIKHIHLANKLSTGATFSLFVGTTTGSTGGTELFGAKLISGNDTYDYYCNLRMASTDFLSGLASTGSGIVITVEGEQAVV